MLPLLLLLVFVVEQLAKTKLDTGGEDEGATALRSGATACRSCGRENTAKAGGTAGGNCAGCHKPLDR